MVNDKLKQAIISWIFKNLGAWQITTSCIITFKAHIYDSKGDYLVGGDEVYDFCRNAITLITKN